MSKELQPVIHISQFTPFKNKDGDTVPGVMARDSQLYKELYKFKEGAYSVQIRELRSLETKEERSKYKLENLIAFTFACSFKEGDYRKQNNIRAYSGVMYIDIDATGCADFLKKKRLINMNYTIQNMRDELFDALPCIWAGLSCSGTGVFLLIKCLEGDRADVFEDVKNRIYSTWGITIDVACKDAGRLTFATYDAGGKIANWTDVQSWSISPDLLRKKAEKEKWKKHEKDQVLVYHTSELPGKIMSKAITMIKNSQKGERHNKIIAASRLLGGYVGSGLLDETFVYDAVIQAVIDIDYDNMPDAKKAIDWGLRTGKENPLDLEIITPDDPHWDFFTEQDEVRQRDFKNLYSKIHEYIRDGVSQNKLDLVSLAREFYVDTSRITDIADTLYQRFSYEFNINNLPNIAKIEAYLTGKYDFQRDVITGDLQGRKRNFGDYQFVRYENIWREVQRQGYKFKYEDIVRLLNSDYVPLINPWEKYFASIVPILDDNNNEIDYIEYCASFVKCRDASLQPYFNLMFKKMLVRTIRCALDDNYANRTVFVLVSNTQNNGKSTFIRWLNPFGLHQYYAENSLEDNKDSRIRLGEVFIYNLEELATISKIEINKLKAIISQVGTRDRKPFGRQAENIVRRCSFWGSTNLSTFLTDDNNTRWLCFDIKKIDFTYMQKVDKDQMWGQAYRLYKSGYNSELSQDESESRDKQNTTFQIQTVEGDLLSKYFEPAKEGEYRAVFLTSTSIHERLLLLTKESRIKISSVWIGRSLSRLGYTRVRKNNIYGYWVRPINQDVYTSYNNDGENKLDINEEAPF
jgi:hypothetical protein